VRTACKHFTLVLIEISSFHIAQTCGDPQRAQCASTTVCRVGSSGAACRTRKQLAHTGKVYVQCMLDNVRLARSTMKRQAFAVMQAGS
jgi:hypothetical protein